MAKISVINKILKSDVPDAPSWSDVLISTLNQFFDVAIIALKGRLTFTDNFLCDYKELTFTSGEELQILTNMSTYGGVLIVKPPNEQNVTIASYGARQIKNKTVGVTINLTGATASRIGLIILG